MGCGASSQESLVDNSANAVSQSRVPGVLDYSGLGLVCIPNVPSTENITSIQLPNNFLTTLPGTFNFPVLEELDLSSNRFVRIPDVLKKQPALKQLNMSNNPLNKNGGYEVLPHIKTLVNLRLAMCSIRKVPEPLSKCTEVERLDISFNHFIDLNGDDLPQLSALRELNCSNCSLRGPVPEGIKATASLRVLDISTNSLDLSNSDNAFGSVLEANLETLHANGIGWKEVPKAVANLKNLRTLHLVKNASPSLASFQSVDTKLQELNISDCEYTQLPAGLSAIGGSLTSLDLSFNEAVEFRGVVDAAPNLVKLGVVGCRFVRGDGRDMEWFEIGRLQQLQQLEWSVWGEARKSTGLTINPYTTKIPVQLVALKLTHINGLKVRDHLFTGDPLVALKKVLKDGYYKADFLFEPQALAEQHNIMELLKQRNKSICTALEVDPSAAVVMQQRYVFFLHLQFINSESVLLPPIDVVCLHYAHMMLDPEQYESMGKMYFGDTVDNNYRGVLFEDVNSGQTSRYSNFWDNTVAELENQTGRVLPWLKYSSGSANFAQANPLQAPELIPNAGDAIDLLPILNPKNKQAPPLKVAVSNLCSRFSTWCDTLLPESERIEQQGVDVWLRYAKFLTMCPRSSSGSTVSSPAVVAESPNDDGNSTTPFASPDLPSEVCPTTTIRDVMYLHRTCPIKYNLLLQHFGLSHIKCEDNANFMVMAGMNSVWEEWFDEPYIANTSAAETMTDPDGVSSSNVTDPEVASNGNPEKSKKKRRVTIATRDVE